MNTLFKGILYVAGGALSYGMLATFVKLAYKSGYTTAEVTTSQFLLGIVIVGILYILFSKKRTVYRQDIFQLMLCGTTMGFTSVLYYLCVKYLNASIAVVLLMQSVWIGVLIEVIQTKKKPSIQKIIAVILVLLGTVLATNIMANDITINWKGLIFGILSSISFSLTLYTSNSIATHLAPLQRSFFMLLGGAVIVFSFAFITQIGPTYFQIDLLQTPEIASKKAFDISIFQSYGILLALFGTILPPILLNKGFPLTGVGVGSIVSSLELPVSAMFAHIVLAEPIRLIQWGGILVILIAFVFINWETFFKKNTSN